MSGQTETLKSSEMIITRNIKAVVQHGNESRQIVRDLERRTAHLENENMELKKEIEGLKRNLSLMQAKLYELGRE